MTKERESFNVIWNKLSVAQKSRDGALPYTLFVNRPTGRFLAIVAYKLNLTPNQITVISFVSTIIGLLYVVIIGYQSLLGVIISTLMLLLGYSLDSADGQLARLNNLKSSAGEYLDHVFDSIKIPFFHISVVMVILRSIQDINFTILFFLLLISVIASGKFFSSEIKEKILTLKGKHSLHYTTSLKKSFLLLPFDYGVLCFIFILTPFNLLLPVYLIWGLLFLVFFILSFARGYRQLSNL
jgi:phosphatidylglycerophosphate synthase